jgi:hypothetical protein
MTFSAFFNKFYVRDKEKIDNEARFIDILFTAAGSDFFSKSPKTDAYKYKLFKGRKPITKNMITSLNINEDYFVSYLAEYFNQESLIKIFENYGISGVELNRNILLKALCRELKRIIKRQDDSADRVAFEYKLLLPVAR